MTKNYDYIAYIDEAGETGLSNIITAEKNGSSEWLILAATVVSAKREKDVLLWKDEITSRCASRQARSFHFRKAKLNQQIEAATRASSYHLRHFAVCSNKRNLENYRNMAAARQNPVLAGMHKSKSGWLYYWLVRLLLERVTDFVQRRSMMDFGEPRNVRLEFSKNGGVRYDELLGYFEYLKEQSETKRTFISHKQINWNVINLQEVGVYAHHTRAGLIFPDIVASSFYQACDKLERGKPVEPRPAMALMPRMAGLKKNANTIVHRDYGVKLMPHPNQMNIDTDQQQVFREYGYRFK